MIFVCVDVDDVCADIMPVWLDKYNRDYDDNLTSEDITAWGIDRFVKPECGIKIYDYLTHEDFYTKTQPLPGFQEAIREFKRRGWDVMYVTSVVPGSADIKIKWLYAHAPGFSMDELVIANRKNRVIGDVLIDDAAHNLKSATMKTVRFIRPHNQGVAANAHTDSWIGMADKVLEAYHSKEKYVLEEVNV